MRNEYQIMRFGPNDTEYGNREKLYFYNRREAIAQAKKWLAEDSAVDNVDLQVIYDCDDSESDLGSNPWWEVRRDGIKKHA